MVAEISRELPFSPGGMRPHLPQGSRYVIAEGEHQETEVITGRARVGRGVSANYSLEVPLDYLSSEVLDVYVKGCGASEVAYAPLRRAGSQLGKIGLTVGSPRGTVVGDLLSPQDIFHAERYQQRAVSAALDDIERRGYVENPLVNLVGHSMGGRDAVAVAEDAPERVNSVKLVSAAGLERHNILVLAGRLHPFVTRDAGPNFNLLQEEFQHRKALAELGWHILSNPLRMGVDVVSISQADIRPRVLELGDKGIRVAILDMLSDELIPNKTVERGIGSQVDMYRWHPNPYFGHVAPQTHALEVAWELHDMDEVLFPEEVVAPREFAVQAMGRSVKTRPTVVGAYDLAS